MRSVFLDLDGTLTDSRPGIIRCIRHALAELGTDAPDEDALTWCIGPPLLGSFERLLGDPSLAQRGLALYRERFGSIGLYENRVYDGVPGMLERLHEGGFRLFLATSKPHVYAGRIVARFKLDRWVERVFGAELDGTHADKPSLIAHALSESGADPARSVMLGDREHDAIGATANGLPCIGAVWGYGGADELGRAGAAALAETPAAAALLIEQRLADTARAAGP
jgi:phosphoglycolate phosphatase